MKEYNSNNFNTDLLNMRQTHLYDEEKNYNDDILLCVMMIYKLNFNKSFKKLFIVLYVELVVFVRAVVCKIHKRKNRKM